MMMMMMMMMMILVMVTTMRTMMLTKNDDSRFGDGEILKKRHYRLLHDITSTSTTLLNDVDVNHHTVY